MKKGLIAGRCYHGQVDQAASETLNQLIAVSVHDSELDVGVFPDERLYPLGGDIRGRAFHKADGDCSVHDLSHQPDFVRSLIGEAEDLLCVPVEQLSGIGELQMALPADEQRGVQFLFQGLYLAAERRLTDVFSF